jgi:hypothetical protein
MKNLTIEQLAEKMNESVWTKGDLKRIYLNDAGHNTKKMSTKAYIYQENDEFKVSVYIDCPSQNYNWIKSQQEEVKERILEEIQDVICDTIFIAVNGNGNPVDENGSEISLNDIFLERFFTKEKCENFIEENIYTKGVVSKSFDRKELDSEIERLDKIERKEKVKINEEKKIISKVEKSEKPKSIVSEMYGIGSKIRHNRFGIGEVISETENNVVIKFPEVGEKSLIKKFANLTKV